MNKKQNAAKKYLSQAFGLNQRIESKIDQIAVLNDLATKATVTYSDMPKSPNRDGSRMEDAIIKIIDLTQLAFNPQDPSDRLCTIFLGFVLMPVNKLPPIKSS